MTYSIRVGLSCKYRSRYNTIEESEAWADRVINLAIYDKLNRILQKTIQENFQGKVRFSVKHAILQETYLESGSSTTYLVPVSFEVRFLLKAKTRALAKQKVLNFLNSHQEKLNEVFTKPVEICFRSAKLTRIKQNIS